MSEQEPHKAVLTKDEFEQLMETGKIVVRCGNAPGYCTIEVVLNAVEYLG